MQKLFWKASMLKQGKKTVTDVAGNCSLPESTSENGNRPVSFAQMYNIITVGTKFQHKKSTREHKMADTGK